MGDLGWPRAGGPNCGPLQVAALLQPLLLQASRHGFVRVERLPSDIGSAAQGEIDLACCRRAVAERVDENETAEIAVLAVGLAEQRPADEQRVDPKRAVRRTMSARRRATG
jgi:hypothetical protein